MNKFKIIGLLSEQFKSSRIIIDTIGEVSVTKVIVSGKECDYLLTQVGIDVCFTVRFDDKDIESVMSIPNETMKQYVSRIICIVNSHG